MALSEYMNFDRDSSPKVLYTMTLVATFFRSFFPIFQSHNKIIHIDVHSHGGLEKWSVIFFVWKNIIGFLFWKVVIYLSKRNEKICNGLISRAWAKHYFWYFISIFALTYFQNGEYSKTLFFEQIKDAVIHTMILDMYWITV